MRPPDQINVPALIAAAEQILGASVGYLHRVKGTPRPQCHRLNVAWKELARELGHEGSAVWVMAKDALPGLQIQGRDDSESLMAYEVIRVTPEENASQVTLTLVPMEGHPYRHEVEKVFNREALILLRVTE